MNDTRETMTKNLTASRRPADNENGEDIAPELRPAPRFKAGDEVIPALYPDRVMESSEPYWDYEFSGWLISPGFIGVHECNFILESEREQWEPHADGLWSWWTRKDKEIV
jgi:hypothetical protein